MLYLLECRGCLEQEAPLSDWATSSSAPPPPLRPARALPGRDRPGVLTDRSCRPVAISHRDVAAPELDASKQVIIRLQSLEEPMK
ncbi:hypothetical protein [Streptomyces dysideae]|uniref:hypothetical protein n=1 Tax=Streptomyces dysideae TaxID=909626 RepID=UPI000AC01E4F|nr:hypothetical protein [Streptomyces dysideae]